MLLMLQACETMWFLYKKPTLWDNYVEDIYMKAYTMREHYNVTANQ